ncbi:Colicin-Ia [compost metagenome]
MSKKFGVQDREAIARALDALDKEVMSKNLTAFGKGLKTIGNLTDLFSLLAEAQTSSKSGDWIPFFVKVESLVVGKGATALVAFMFGLTAATPMTILGFALLTAVISSLIDDALVGKINDYVINL